MTPKPIKIGKALLRTSFTKARKQIVVYLGPRGGLYYNSKGRRVYLRAVGWAYRGGSGKAALERMTVYERMG